MKSIEFSKADGRKPSSLANINEFITQHFILNALVFEMKHSVYTSRINRSICCTRKLKPWMFRAFLNDSER